MTAHEIKFRVWHDKWARFMYFFPFELCVTKGDYQLVAEEQGKTVYHYWENVLQQFTGFLDVQGREIYEGDIMEGYAQTRRFGGKTSRKCLYRGVVERDPWTNGFCMNNHPNHDAPASYKYRPCMRECKIVGHILETK